MFRMFSFLPPIGSYILAVGIFGATYFAHSSMVAGNPEADVNKVWLVGGIVAFLLAFGGFQKSMELRGEAKKPRVSSSDVLQKLAPTDGMPAEDEPDMPSHLIHEPMGDSPITRVRARSNPQTQEDKIVTATREPAPGTPLARVRARSNPAEPA